MVEKPNWTTQQEYEELSASNNAVEDFAIEVEGISKKFCRDLKRSLLYGARDFLGEALCSKGEENGLRNGEFWALQNVSFKVRKGDALGLVGANGSGKTTLLRIISGLIKPDGGSVKTYGTVAPLLAAGVGFNPILTGRENIRISMSIAGLTRKQIDSRFDEVLDFSELPPDALDAPVKSYSSGMKARLGFSCAIHTTPDILLIDEVLAVGDTKFRSKCQRKLQELRELGVTFVMVNHNPHVISTACESGVYLSKGQMLMSGDIASVLQEYEADEFIGEARESDLGHLKILDKDPHSPLAVEEVYFRNEAGSVQKSPLTGECIVLCVACRTLQPLSAVGLILRCTELSGEGKLLFHARTWDDGIELELDARGKYELQVKMPFFALDVGRYQMDIVVTQNRLAYLHKVEGFKFATMRRKPSGRRAVFEQPCEYLVSKQVSCYHSAE